MNATLDQSAHIHELLNRAPKVREFIRFAKEAAAENMQLPSSLEEHVALPHCRLIRLRASVQRSSRHRFQFTLEAHELLKPQASAVGAALSAREFQILQLAATGISSSKIGEQLSISPWTVKNHLKAIYAKTGVSNRVGLARLLG